MEDESTLIDTNILAYAYDKSEKTKHEKAAKILLNCWQHKKQYHLSTQNLNEFYVTVTKKIQNPLPQHKAKTIIDDIIDFTGWHIHPPTPQTIKKAIYMSIKYGLHYWDSLIAATMCEHNLNTIITENQKDFRKIPHIKTKNPFTKKH